MNARFDGTGSAGKWDKRKLPESASLLLDVIRFAAALMVVITHAAAPELNTGFNGRHDQMAGNVAVPVFFVLSGFMIRFVTRTRETTLREYAIDRASRIYSGVLPALAVSALVGGMTYLLNPALFRLGNYGAMFQHPLTRLAMNTLFLSQAWGLQVTPFNNGPFWSLGYECPYYVFYALLFFRRGWKTTALIVLLAVLVGPQVLFLMPIWWLGCWLYEAYEALRGTRVAAALVMAAGVWLAVSLALAAAGRWSLLALPIVCFVRISSLPNPLVLLHLPVAQATMFAVAAGIATAPVLLVLLLAAEYVRIEAKTRWAGYVRRIADATFLVYLLHRPLLILAAFLGLFRVNHNTGNDLVILGILALLIGLAGPVDGLKRAMRRWLRDWTAGWGGVAA